MSNRKKPVVKTIKSNSGHVAPKIGIQKFFGTSGVDVNLKENETFDVSSDPELVKDPFVVIEETDNANICQVTAYINPAPEGSIESNCKEEVKPGIEGSEFTIKLTESWIPTGEEREKIIKDIMESLHSSLTNDELLECVNHLIDTIEKRERGISPETDRSNRLITSGLKLAQIELERSIKIAEQEPDNTIFAQAAL